MTVVEYLKYAERLSATHDPKWKDFNEKYKEAFSNGDWATCENTVERFAQEYTSMMDNLLSLSALEYIPAFNEICDKGHCTPDGCILCDLNYDCMNDVAPESAVRVVSEYIQSKGIMSTVTIMSDLTRADKFKLENVDIALDDEGLPEILPCILHTSYKATRGCDDTGCKGECEKCRKDYWKVVI